MAELPKTGNADLDRLPGTRHTDLATGETVMRKMAAAQCKAKCLAVMDQVARSGQPVVITKHGKPVVKVVPAKECEEEIFGALSGIARITGDVENTVPAGDWGEEWSFSAPKFSSGF